MLVLMNLLLVGATDLAIMPHSKNMYQAPLVCSNADLQTKSSFLHFNKALKLIGLLTVYSLISNSNSFLLQAEAKQISSNNSYASCVQQFVSTTDSHAFTWAPDPHTISDPSRVMYQMRKHFGTRSEVIESIDGNMVLYFESRALYPVSCKPTDKWEHDELHHSSHPLFHLLAQTPIGQLYVTGNTPIKVGQEAVLHEKKEQVYMPLGLNDIEIDERLIVDNPARIFLRGLQKTFYTYTNLPTNQIRQYGEVVAEHNLEARLEYKGYTIKDEHAFTVVDLYYRESKHASWQLLRSNLELKKRRYPVQTHEEELHDNEAKCWKKVKRSYVDFSDIFYNKKEEIKERTKELQRINDEVVLDFHPDNKNIKFEGLKYRDVDGKSKYRGRRIDNSGYVWNRHYILSDTWASKADIWHDTRRGVSHFFEPTYDPERAWEL